MHIEDLLDSSLQLGDQLSIRVIAESTQGDSLPSIQYSDLLAFAPDAPI